MKFRLLTCLLAAATTAGRAEDCPLLVNQRFQLHFNQWQSNQGPTTTTSQAVYEVEASVPVITYRLGALVLNGAVEYNRLATGQESDGAAGLNRYGLRVNLFPYRPFRLYLDYRHSQTPDLFGSGKILGDVWGAGFTYGSRAVQDLRVSYRHGSSRLDELRDDWSLWRLEAKQHEGNTDLLFNATRQDFKAFGTDQGWRLFVATLDTESHIGRDWFLRSRSQVQDTRNARWYDAGATLYGPISGAFHSLTNLSVGATLAGGYRTGTFFGSESLVYTRGRWQTHTTGAFSQAALSELGQGTRTASFTTGATFTLTEDWRVHGDGGISRVRRTFEFQDTSRTATTLNLGVARGGDVPELIRHSLFFLSDWSFDRRIREEYPPDFVPSELAQEMLRRRMRQTGSFGFTADLWRMTDNQNHGRLDWARVTGQVKARGGFAMYLAGDYRHDRGMVQEGLENRTADLSSHASYRAGSIGLTASFGYSRHHQTVAGTSLAADTGLASAEGQSRHYSMGLTSQVRNVPFGILFLRYDPPLAYPTRTLTTWTDITFRQVSLRLRYEVSRMDNGFRSSRIVVDLLRWFDTLCVGSV